MDSVLELRGLSKHFPHSTGAHPNGSRTAATHPAVDNISLSLARGEFFSLIGPSGCGKTTTLRLIAGFESPSAGDILLDQRSLLTLKPYQRDVSTVFQNYALFPHLTVFDNIAFGLERRRLPTAAIRNKVSDALALVHLDGKQHRFPHQISGGERQRVALARALVVEPKLLLLDEPLSALDPNLRKQVRAELKTLQREIGITFLFITHDQEEALSLSDRLGVMHHGRLEQVGPPREVYRQPQTRFVAEFLGEVNWFPSAGVRPEALNIARQKPNHDLPSLPAVVSGLTFLGSRVHLHADCAGGEACKLELDESNARYQPGDSVHIWWHPSDELRLPAT